MVEDSIKEKLKREIIGILLVALGIFLFVSLVTFDPADPSFFLLFLFEGQGDP